MKNILDKNIRLYLVVAVLVLCSFVQKSIAQDNVADADTTEYADKAVDVAYGKQSYNSVTSSISTIYSDELAKSTVGSIGEMLMGRLPGLTVTKTTGEPGSAPSLLIRGKNTYNTDNSPLVIVDGFQIDYFQQLSPFEIESISVLKDASAVALYGQKAANGVILVTTKRGKAGKIKIDFNINTGWQSPTTTPDLLNAGEYATLYNEALVNDGLETRYTTYDIENYGRDGAALYTHPDNRFFDQLIKSSSPITMGGVNLSGGSEAVRFMVSLGFMHEGGIFNYTDLSDSYSTQSNMYRYNLRSNIDIQITKNLSAKVELSGQIGQSNSPGATISSIFNSMYSTPPQEYPMINPDGTPGGSAQFINNPYGLIALRGFRSSTNRNFNSNLRLRYDFDGALKGLSVGVAGGVSDWMSAGDDRTKSKFAVYAIDSYLNDTTATYTKYNDDVDLSWGSNAISNQRMMGEANATYEVTFGKHSLNTMIMFHIDQFSMNTNHYTFKNIGGGFRTHYGYDNRLFAELSAGYYGEEQYMAGKRFGLFPAGALAWVISNEAFLKDNEAINYLKLRASYGMVGGSMSFSGKEVTERIFYNQYYSGATGAKFGTNSQTSMGGRQEGRAANPDITWDKSYKTDVALEAILFNHVNLMFNYYNDKRTDILTVDSRIPGPYGMNNGRQSYLNTGEVTNAGYDATLGISGKSSDFEYNVYGGLWFNRSNIVHDPKSQIYEFEHRNIIGKPVGQIFGYETAGIFASDEAAQDYQFAQTFGDVGAGDVSYIDQTGDGVIDENDMLPMGYTAVPEYTYSLGIDLRYKGFTFSVFGQGTLNSSSMPGGYYFPFSTQGNAFSYALDRWHSGNLDAKYPRLSTVANTNNTLNSDIWLASKDYFKLRNIEVGYNLSEDMLSKLNIGSARIFVRGMNLLFIADHFDFVDPETLKNYPAMKSISLGISTSF